MVDEFVPDAVPVSEESPSTEMAEERWETISWTLQKYGSGGNYSIAPYSKQHLLDPEVGRTLCGLAPGVHSGPNFSGRCDRCYGRARRVLTSEAPEPEPLAGPVEEE